MESMVLEECKLIVFVLAELDVPVCLQKLFVPTEHQV